MPSELNLSKKPEMKALLHSELWGMVRAEANKLIQSWQSEMGRGATIDEYVMMNIKRDGRVDGVRSFLAELEKYARK